MICSHVVLPLRRVAPDLADGGGSIAALCASCERLRLRHVALARRMTAATVASRTGDELAVALGEELRGLTPSFEAYVEYCAAFMHAMRGLEDALRERPAVERCIDEAQRGIAEARERGGTARPPPGPPAGAAGAACGGREAVAPLFASLIKPVQRLCQYPLLFREIVAELHVAREAHAAAESALGALEGSVTDVNERVRQRERDWPLRRTGELQGAAASPAPSPPVRVAPPGKRRRQSLPRRRPSLPLPRGEEADVRGIASAVERCGAEGLSRRRRGSLTLSHALTRAVASLR